MLVELIAKYLKEKPQERMRDRRAWYASELTKPARDLYWKATGEPETNPTDLTGLLKMFAGSALEAGLGGTAVGGILNQLAPLGIHFYGAQTQVGGSSPDVDGKLDGFLHFLGSERRAGRLTSGKQKPWVLEIKTKYGYGATLFKQGYNPGENYLVQIGYYLRDLSRRGVTDRGMFLFWLLGDQCFGEMIEILCRYDATTDEVIAYKATHIDGTSEDLDYRVKIQPFLERIVRIEKYIADCQVPPPDKRYKHELTPDFLSSVSDTDLRRMIKGEKVLGDWEVSYSSYKNKHAALEGGLGYSEEELQLIDAEHKSRFPGGRLKPALKGKLKVASGDE